METVAHATEWTQAMSASLANHTHRSHLDQTHTRTCTRTRTHRLHDSECNGQRKKMTPAGFEPATFAL
jgi:hypothetical protein